jgi:hypothetical protein
MRCGCWPVYPGDFHLSPLSLFFFGGNPALKFLSAIRGKILPLLTFRKRLPKSPVKITMARTLPIIGIEPEELPWIRLLVSLLRHPDPVVPELAHQALLYLEKAAAHSSAPGDRPAGQAG